MKLKAEQALPAFYLLSSKSICSARAKVQLTGSFLQAAHLLSYQQYIQCITFGDPVVVSKLVRHESTDLCVSSKLFTGCIRLAV